MLPPVPFALVLATGIDVCTNISTFKHTGTGAQSFSLLNASVGIAPRFLRTIIRVVFSFSFCLSACLRRPRIIAKVLGIGTESNEVIIVAVVYVR